MKLMYLGERLSFLRYGESLTGDSLVSMDHGPVLSQTLNLINGAVEGCPEDGWDSWISDRQDHDVALADPSRIRSPEEDLLELSDSDIEVLTETWNEYGHMGKWQLRDFTHTLPEWTDPEGSMLPIEHVNLFKHLGFTAEQASVLEERRSSSVY